MKKYGNLIFLTVQALLYFIFVTGDILNYMPTRVLKLVSVGLIALFSLKEIRTKEDKTASLIFAFTFVADIFFVLMNKPIYGIGVYIIIQLIHTLRLTYFSSKSVRTEMLKRIIPAFILLIIGSFVGPMVMLILPYAYLIGTNILHGALNYNSDKSRVNLLYLAGLIILVAGDLGVGLRNLQFDFVTETVAHIAYVITWITYIPSLILILGTTNSLTFKKKD